MPDEYMDVFLSEEDFMLRDTLRDFVNKEIVPVRQQIDDDKDHVIVNGIIKKLIGMGLQRAAFPEEYGGLGAGSAVTLAMIHEELGRGDAGIGTAFTVTGWCWQAALVAQNKAVMDRFAAEFCGDDLKMGCFAMTEPTAGCDIENITMRGTKIRTKAVLDGDEWVINGAKMWASNSGVADLYCVVCTTDPNLGDDGIAMIYVPKDAKGVSFGKNENKAGMAADKNHPMFLENVRVPKEWRAGGPGVDADLLHNNLVAGRIMTAATATGQAQAVFDTVLKYTEERVVGNKPIRQHSVAANILADMAIGIETSRLAYLSAAWMYDHPERYAPRTSHFMLSRGSIAKMHACDVAVSVCNRAMELMGSYGYVREYDVEKYWRDSKIVQLWEGGAQLGRFDVCRGYYDLTI